MERERLLLIFEHSPEEPRLTGVGEAIRALGENDIDVKVAAPDPAVNTLIGRVLRFWFPYLWSAGITGAVPGAAEVGEFVVTLVPKHDPAFGRTLGAWLQARYGRKIRVKVDGVEIEAQAQEQIETLLGRLEALRPGRSTAATKKP